MRKNGSDRKDINVRCERGRREEEDSGGRGDSRRSRRGGDGDKAVMRRRGGGDTGGGRVSCLGRCGRLRCLRTQRECRRSKFCI